MDSENSRFAFLEKIPPALKRPAAFAILLGIIALVWLLLSMATVGIFSGMQFMAVLGVGLVLIFAAVYILYFLKEWKYKLIAVLMVILMFSFSWFSTRSLGLISSSLHMMTRSIGNVTQSVSLYTYTQAPVATLQALEGQTVGILESRSTGMNEVLISELADQGVNIKTQSYSSLVSLVKALKGQAVRAVILDKSELYLISESAGMEKVRKELSAIYTATRETDVSTKAEDINVQKEPFTILLSTSQDSVDSMAYRSDLNLLLTINPKTRTIYTVVVPRSVWAEYACDSELACPAGQEDKVGFASLYSQEGLKATIEKLLDTKIDFTMRIDLQEMITMLDLDQTVTITTEDGDVAMTYPKLLQYIGSQNDYSSANTSQENREMNVLSALYTQLDLNSVSRLKSYASILASSIHTSASYNQLASLVKMLFMENGSWTTYQTEITGEIDTRYSIALTEYGYALIPYEDILEQTRKAIADVLSGSTPDLSIVRETELETQTDDSENQEDSEYDANGENEDEDENSDEYTDDQDTWSDDSDYNSANDSYNSYDQSYGSNDYGSNSYGNSSGSWQSGQSGSGSNQNGYSNNSNNGYSNGYDYSSSYDEDEYDDDDDGYGNWSSRP